jgi:alpha-mannosidase
MVLKEKTLYMIGNAHLDPVWLWQWQEGFQEAKATFRSALDRINEYDDFIFTSSSAAYYEWIEKNDSNMFEEIRHRIAEGRWNITGGWWVQPDCNIPGGESYVRQGLYAQHYFKKKFGVIATVGYNVDSFGHNGMLPQILKKSGMEHYVFMRPMPLEKGLPGSLFWWESDDGSRVLTFRILYEYCSSKDEIDKHVKRCTDELRKPFNELMCFYGVGNHGGGPTKANIENIMKLDKDENAPRMLFSTPEKFFQDIKRKELPLPVVHDDLQHHASGCYAAHSGIKRWNRKAENLLVTAEKFSTIAQLVTGQSYPNDFDRAWKNVLFNQFHDILAGTSLEAAYDDARDLHGEAMSIASRNLNYAIQSMTWNINIEQNTAMKPIVVFNPHAWESEVNVELELSGCRENSILLDDDGLQVPLQLVQSQATANGRYRLSFIAKLPSLGYRVYKFFSSPIENKNYTTKIIANDYSMENNRYRLVIDPKTGFITNLYDKIKQFNILRGEAARPVVIEDTSDTWSHNIFEYKKEIGVFNASSIKLVELGPVKATIRVISQYGASKLIQDFNMYNDLDTIDVNVTVDWREEFKMFKLKFPVNLAFRSATYEIPYGHIERPANGEEEPGQSWIDFTGEGIGLGERYGLSLLNDGKYSFDFDVNEMNITVLRSPIYAHHDPAVPLSEKYYSFIDQGIQHFSYSLLPHEGSWKEAGTVRRAAELNQKAITLLETYHSGTLSQKASFLSVDCENIIVSAMKHAEEGDDLIIRCYETSKIATRVKIEFSHLKRTIEAEFGPCEIKTFRVPKDSNFPVVETNLLEWEEG